MFFSLVNVVGVLYAMSRTGLDDWDALGRTIEASACG